MAGWDTGEVIGGPRMNAQGPWPLGGAMYEEIVSTSFVPIPGLIIVEIDGTDLDNPNVADVEVHVTAFVASGTGTFRLRNITTGASIGADQSFVNTTVDLIKLTGLAGLLATGVNKYRLEAKVAAAVDRAVINGSVLVIR